MLKLSIVNRLFYNRLHRRMLSGLYRILLGLDEGIDLTGAVHIRGIPIIDVRKGGLLRIGDNVVLNSENSGYHVNMHSPVKIIVKNGAVVTIGENTRIHGTSICAWERISIGGNCLVAANCHLMDSNGHALSLDDPHMRITTKGESKPIICEDNVWIGANVIVLPGVKIGTGAVVGAGSVVAKDIPPGVIAAGNPARVINEQ